MLVRRRPRNDYVTNSLISHFWVLVNRQWETAAPIMLDTPNMTDQRYFLGANRVEQMLNAFTRPFGGGSPFAVALQQPGHMADFFERATGPTAASAFRRTALAFAELLQAGTIQPTASLGEVTKTIHRAVCARDVTPRTSFNRLKIIPRLVLFAQYQGAMNSFDWSHEDVTIARKFHDRLLSECQSEKVAQRDWSQIVHLIIWCRLNGIRKGELFPDQMEAFVAHTSGCPCFQCLADKPSKDSQLIRPRALYRWQRFLDDKPIVKENGLVVRQKEAGWEKPDSVAAYAHYLEHDRGLVKDTIRGQVSCLEQCHPQLGEDASLWTARHIRDVAQTAITGKSPGRQSTIISIIRGYIRFRAMRGECSADLVEAIISRPVYRHTRLPTEASYGELRAYIEGCDTSTATGLRNRAMMTILADTGARARELSTLKYSDIDWEEAEFRTLSKNRREDIMPLTKDIARAIEAWTRDGRPKSEDPHVFIRLRRPYCGLSHNQISTSVHDELRRQGYRGKGAAHLYRHAIASKLLSEGCTLPEIGRALRHRLPTTTMIYAKADAERLRQIAQPWPGEEQ